MKITAGLVSVSFRQLSASDIIKLSKEAGLASVEWGGDVHVPAGDVAVAGAVGEETLKNGLAVSEYGSYYRIGVSDPKEIVSVAASAHALGTRTVRVWAYNKGSQEITEKEYNAIVEDARRICLSYPELTFCTECHNDTLTDDYKANLRLIHDVAMPNFAAFWQPNQHKTHQYNLESAASLAPFVRAAHVFAWEGNDKYPLERHRYRWVEYVRAFADLEQLDLMLEFMHDNDPASLKETAEELRRIISIAERA